MAENHVAAPIVGEVVHFYELRHGETYGPLAAMVTVLEGGSSNAVNLAVIGEAAIRFVPLVPFADAGRKCGMWWTRARAVEPGEIRQNGL